MKSDHKHILFTIFLIIVLISLAISVWGLFQGSQGPRSSRLTFRSIESVASHIEDQHLYTKTSKTSIARMIKTLATELEIPKLK